MELKPIKAKRIYEEIVWQFKHLMDGGELKPGDRLPSERELAERLRVSRASVREAIRSLEIMGIIETRPGDGTYIKDTVSDIIPPLAMFLAIEQSSLLDMFEIRRIFEGATAGLAAERASDEEIEKIKSALEKMVESLSENDSEKGEEYDIAFHYAIAEASHNSLLIKLYRTLSEDFSRVISAARRQLFLGKSNPQKIVNQHRKIYESIKSREPQIASKKMLEHLIFAEREYKRVK